MSKIDPVEAKLSELSRLSKSASNDELIPLLKKSLTDRYNIIVAKAANIAGEKQLTALSPDLASAFNTWLTKDDRNCTALNALGKALYELGAPEEEIFLKGVKHRAGGFMSRSDPASELRGWCMLGLVRMASRRSMEMLVDLLVDKDPQARSMAIRAAAYSQRDEAQYLLRLKTLTGDAELDVTAECLSALMRAWPRQSADFVARFLNDEDHRPAALSALSESRSPEALAILKEHFARTFDTESRRQLLDAIATMRREPAVDFLIQTIQTAPLSVAGDAIIAMKNYKSDPAIVVRIKQAAAGRDNESLKDVISKILG